MPRDYTQNVNAAQVTSLSPVDTVVGGNITISIRYTVGFLAVGGKYLIIQGAASNNTASVTVPLTSTIANLVTQIRTIVSQQESLDLAQGDRVLFAL